MQLEAYISDLLYRYECVTVPDFGAFLTQSVSASIHESSNTFYPPKKVVSFNEQIKKNDGLLAHYIADVEKIPFEVAIQKIETRIKNLRDNLVQGKTISFDNIGEMVLNSEGKIQFEPSYNLNYLTDAFGLSQFVSPVVAREVYKKQVEQLEKVIPITITEEKRKSRPYLKYAAVALIALTVGGFAASNYYVNQIKSYNQIAQEEAAQQLDAKIQQATFTLNPLPAITLPVTKQSGNYHIVAGAFRIEENCDKKIEQLKVLGYKARKIGVNKYGLHEVVYASYEDRLEALDALKTIKKEHNPDAWLEVKDLNLTNTKVSNNIEAAPVSVNKEKHQKDEPLKDTKAEEIKSKKEIVEDNSIFESPSIIRIIKDVENLEIGFYTILGVHSDTEKRDKFLAKLLSDGYPNVRSFFDKKSQKYFIYNEKFNDLEVAKKSLDSKKYLPFNGRVAIVKIVD